MEDERPRSRSPMFLTPSSPNEDSAASPSSPMSSQSKRAKFAIDPNLKEVYGLNLGLLRRWQNEKNEKLLSSEEAMQEIAVAKVRGFLDAIGCTVKIQSWWRMMKPFHSFNARKREQRRTKFVYYRALRLYWRSERMFRVQAFGKFFIGWRDETRTAKKLKSMVTAFFKICIQRLRLTPQACMAFFNPGEWSQAVAKEDMMKIRRLMLEKIFSGWRTETRELRMVRFKASQILSRMVRRTKGPLWVKEATLVCFHMWFRYIKVKKAYRLDLPDPRFTNPMLPQWTKLMKDITVNRIKRKRTGEVGAHLTRLRAFKNWKHLMTVDRTKPVTPLAVAIIHYSTVLLTKVLHEWHAVIRERGKIMRFRNKLFQVWRRWAPKHKQMRNFNDQAEELIRLKLVQRAYGVMVKLCFNVIGTRTEKIKELRRNFCDRRVVICAYALLHKDSHVMMVDCWRRLYFYWKSRRNWKAVAWHYTYEWHVHKMKVVFLAWKSLTKPSVVASPQMFLTRSSKGAHSTGNTSSSQLLGYLTETEGESEADDVEERGHMSRGSSQESLSTLNSDEVNNVIAPLRPGSTPHAGGNNHHFSTSGRSGTSSATASESGSRPTSPPGSSSSSRRRQSSLRFKMNFSNPYAAGKGEVNKTPNYEKLVRNFVPKGLDIVQKGVEGRLSTKLSSLQFRTFCFALSRSYAQLANKLHQCLVAAGQPVLQTATMSVLTMSQTGAAAATAAASAAEGTTTQLENIDENGEGDQHSVAKTHTSGGGGNGGDGGVANGQSYSRRPTPHHLHHHSSGDSVASEATNGVVGYSERTEYDVHVSKELHFPVHQFFNRRLQERLQTAIDQVDMEEVLRVVSEGAVIETQHMRQIGLHIGDMYLPLFTLLLTNSVQFFADRVTKHDAQAFLMDVQNPISAFLMGSQIERWNRGEVTYREMMQITQDLPTQRYMSGEFSSFYLMRMLILKNIDVKAKQLVNLCVLLPENRTVDQEVPEVLKRQKLAKLYRLRKSLTEMIGGDDTFQEAYLTAINNIPPLVKPPARPLTSPYGEHKGQATAGKDIYTVLREFTLLTGKLTLEAKSIRAPLMERDQRLIDNGFMRQARADFLILRQSCLTDKQKAEILEKQQKAAEKERKAAEKLMKAERKKREKRSGSAGGGKKRGKKGGVGKLGDEEINFDEIDNAALSSDGEGYLSENGDDSHLSDLCKLNFLIEGGLDIGEEGDVRQEVDFQQRTAHFRHPVYLEVWTRTGWRDRTTVREAIQRSMIAFMRGCIRRVVDVLQADKTIGKFNYAAARQTCQGIGPWLVNHVLANVACRRSPTWYVLPKDYWSFRVVRDRVNLELAVTDATLTGIKGRVGQNHSSTFHIANDISSYQKFLKQTRKDIMKIAEKRANKNDADSTERAPYAANIKKCDVKIRAAEKAIEVIRDKLRRAEVQVATGNANGAAEVFIPPEEVPADAKPAKKNKKGESEKAVIQYDFKAVYEMMDAANQEVQRLHDVISEQTAKKKELENVMRMYDWQCQRTSRMLRDLAESRFQVMVDVQAIAVREAKHLETTTDLVATHTSRYKMMKRYQRHLTDFLEGPVADRGVQLAKEAEQRRVSEILNRTPSSSGRAEFSSPSDAKAAAEKAAAKKRGMLSSSGEEISPVPSFRSALGSRASSEQDFLDRTATFALDALNADTFDEEGGSQGEDSIFSCEDESHKKLLDERMRHELMHATPVVDESQETDLTAQDNRTSSQIAVDAEIELAHHNSIENRLKREEALKLLAEEQAKEMATQDLRLRVFDDYWSALPQNAERVQRRKTNEAKAQEQASAEDASTVATAVTEVSAEYLTRTQRIWKSIGCAYWRSKEDFVRTALQSGKNNSTNIHASFRAVDPLDEDLNEMPLLPRMTDESVEEEQDSTINAHLHLISAFEQTDQELWKATAKPEHAMMVSVSIKELLQHGDTESLASGARRGDSHSTMDRSASDASINSNAGPGKMSRQTSHEVPDPHHPPHHSHHHAQHGAHHAAPPLLRGRGTVKPDPFTLIARDECVRFVDHRVSYESDQPILPFGSFDTQQEQERMHAELSVLAQHHFLPPVLEGQRLVMDRDVEHSVAEEDEEEVEAEKEEDAESATSTISSSFRYPRGHKMREYLLSLGIPTASTSERISTSPGETQTSTFEKFDRIFDRLNDSIIGALENALSTDPSVVSRIEETPPPAADGVETAKDSNAGVKESRLRTDGTVTVLRKDSFEEQQAIAAAADAAKAAEEKEKAEKVVITLPPEPRLEDVIQVSDLGDLAQRLAGKKAPAASQYQQQRRAFAVKKTPAAGANAAPSGSGGGSGGEEECKSRSVKFNDKPDVAGSTAGSRKLSPSLSGRATMTPSSPAGSRKEDRKRSISSAIPGAAGGFSPSTKSGVSSTSEKAITTAATATAAAIVSSSGSSCKPSTLVPAAVSGAPSPSGRSAAPSPKGSRPSSARPISARLTSAKAAPTTPATSAKLANIPTVLNSPSTRAASLDVEAEQEQAPVPVPSTQPLVFSDTLTSAANAAVVAIPQPVILQEDNNRTPTDAGSVVSPQRSLITPQKLDIPDSRSPSRAKMVFSDDLLPSSRDLLEDDVTSEISMEQFVDEHGVEYKGNMGAFADYPPGFRHPDLERVRRQSKQLGGGIASTGSADANSPSSWSRSGTPTGTAPHSPRSTGSGDVGSGGGSGPGGRPKLTRGNTFDESLGKLRDSISLSVDTEPPPFYTDGTGEPQLYLPERAMREALFGSDLDMGAEGLASFLQSFAVPEPVVEKKRTKKVTIDINAAKGSVATKVNGEWVLQPSPMSPAHPYSPKIGPFSPSAVTAAAKSSTFGSNVSPGLPTQPAGASVSRSASARKDLLVAGTPLSTSEKNSADDVLHLKVPALSPNDHRRLAQKLGLDMDQQQSLQEAVASGATVDPAAPVSADLLGLVKEFYVEKALEEQKLERLKEKAAVSYYPANFRQHQDRLKDDTTKASQGDLRYLLAHAGLFDEDSHSENDEQPSARDELMSLLQPQPGMSSKLSSGPDTPHMLHNNTMRPASFARNFSSTEGTPDETQKSSRRASTKGVGGGSSPSRGSTDMSRFSSNDILAAVAAVAGFNGGSGASNHPAGSDKAAAASEKESGKGSDKESGKESSITPGRRMSLKMERMLSRRNSYNPTEIRLELLSSIHDTEESDSNLDAQVDSAVKEVKKYLHDREEERNAVHPPGKLRNKESLARSYREAIQNRSNPYKSLAVQRSLQQLAEQEALMMQASHRRAPAPTPSSCSPPSSPTAAAAASKRMQQQLMQQRHLQQPPADPSEASQVQQQHELSAHVKMPTYSRALADSGDGFVDEQKYEYVVKRAGTPEFWVDVAKIVPPAATATTSAGSAAEPGKAGDGVAALHRWSSEQSAAGTCAGGDQDDMSAVSGGEVRRLGGRNSGGNGQILILHDDDGLDYQQSVVLGFGNDEPADQRQSDAHQHIGQLTQSHSYRARDAVPNLKLSVDAVKLQHPVSSSVDPKSLGQYVLYREQSPLRSSRRSPSPQPHQHQGFSRTNTNTSTATNGTNGEAAAVSGKRNLAYSHSDGQLLGANNILTLTGTKAKLNVPATTSKVLHRGAADDNGAPDDHTTDGDTILSTLSPMIMNLSVKPFSPPPLSGPSHFSASTIESACASDSAAGASAGVRPTTPDGAITGSLSQTSGDENYHQRGDGRSSGGHRSPSSRPTSKATNRLRSYSKDIEISNPNSRPGTPGGDNLSSSLPGAGFPAVLVLPTTPSLRGMKLDDTPTGAGPGDPFSSSDLPGQVSARARDYRSSASAARIISEIAGETYYTGTGAVTGNNSVEGTVENGSLFSNGLWFPAASVVGGMFPSETSGVCVGSNLDAAGNSLVQVPGAKPPTPTAAAAAGGTSQKLSRSPSQSSKRAAPITNYVFSPDSLSLGECSSPPRPFTRTNTAQSQWVTSKPNSPLHTSRSQTSFSFNLQDDSVAAEPIIAAPVKLPAVVAKDYAKSGASSKYKKSTGAPTAAGAGADAAIPNNIIIAGSRKMEPAALDSLMITPQAMSGTSTINVRSSAKISTFAQPNNAASSKSMKAGKGDKTSKAEQQQQRPAAVLERNLSGISSEAEEVESILSTGLSAAHSAALHESVKVPVPVNRVDFVLNENSTISPALVVSTGVHNRAEDLYPDVLHVEVSDFNEDDEAAMEADIERELRQMLNEQHQQDAEDAYREEYYERNKHYLAQAGVAVNKVDTKSHAAALAANVPFMAGSNSKPVASAGVGTTGNSTFDKMKLSSSVGGGGFTGRGNGVLHKVKGAALSASTSQLPPLDPSLFLNVDPAKVYSMSVGNHSQMPGKALGKNKTGKRLGGNALLNDQESLVQNRLVLQSLLHNAMGGSAESMPVYNPLVTSSAKLARQSSIGGKKLRGGSSQQQVRSSLNMVDIVSSAVAERQMSTATNELNQLSLSSNQSMANPNNHGSGSRSLVASRRGSGVDSVNSIGTLGSLPLQSIHAPAVEINVSSSSSNSIGDRGNSALKGSTQKKSRQNC